VNPPAPGWSLTLPPPLWSDLQQHLFRPDDDEHGAVILAGHTDGPRGPRLLARELILATDGVDYIEGTTGYRAFKPEFVRDAALRARDEKLSYLAIHNHFGTTTVSFSQVDLASHERGYPALRKITRQTVGGIGSLVVELLARLGVGHLVLIDHDTVDETNLPRLVAADQSDIGSNKIELAARNAQRVNPAIDLTVIPEHVQHPQALRAVAATDWIFLAADTDAARHWINQTVHQYLVPATQAGVKIPVDAAGKVGRIHVAVRQLIPAGSCMWCDGLINPAALAMNMLPDKIKKRARYVDEVPAPSVIALNSLAAGEAVNHFMLAVTNLHTDDDEHSFLHFPRSGQRAHQKPAATQHVSHAPASAASHAATPLPEPYLPLTMPRQGRQRPRLAVTQCSFITPPIWPTTAR